MVFTSKELPLLSRDSVKGVLSVKAKRATYPFHPYCELNRLCLLPCFHNPIIRDFPTFVNRFEQDKIDIFLCHNMLYINKYPK